MAPLTEHCSQEAERQDIPLALWNGATVLVFATPKWTKT